MSSFIVKQPNGLYCRFSTVVDCPTDWNMTDAYPHTPPRCIKIEKGDVIYILNTEGDEVLKAGDKYKNYNAVVNEVLKEPKRWWQFWKKPKVLGYQIMFL